MNFIVLFGIIFEQAQNNSIFAPFKTGRIKRHIQ